MREKWEWWTKNPQVIREITWLLKRYSRAETPEEKEKYLKKINNWKRNHPSEGRQLEKHLIKLAEKKRSIFNRRKEATHIIKIS